MKMCSTCKLVKAEGDFYWQYKKNKIRSRVCKKCSNHYTKLWYWNNRERCLKKKKVWSAKRKKIIKQFLFEYLSKQPCKSCYEKDPVVLDFHHRDAKEKEFTVGEMSRSNFNLERVKKEVAKCDVLCANCHRRETAEINNWYKLVANRN